MALATTFTVCWLAGPEMMPPPETDHAYEVIPAGAEKVFVVRGQVFVTPAIEQTGGCCTPSTMSSVWVQPFACTTVNRNVALAEATLAVATSEVGESIVAFPLRTLHVVDTTLESPLPAVPVSGKTVSAPSVQRTWSGPACASGPMRNVY